MLRSLSVATRLSRPAPQTALFRALATETAGPKPRSPDRVRGDTDYIKRRRAYRDHLHEQRVAFQKEFAENSGDDASTRDRNRAHTLAARQAREARKREKSEAKQARAKELLEATRVAKEERVAFRRKDWEEGQRRLAARRAADLQLLVERSHEWVTGATLDEHVERAVDEFFISETAGQGKEDVKVIGWQ